MEISALALHCLDQAQAKLEMASAMLASEGTLSPEDTPVDIVDLSVELVSLPSARNDFATDIKMLQAANNMQQQAIDLLAPDFRISFKPMHRAPIPSKENSG